MLTLTPLVLQLLQLGVQVLPGLINAAVTEVELLKSGTAPTAEQQAAIDAALDDANTALMNAKQGA
jgi:hypothetical protein